MCWGLSGIEGLIGAGSWVFSFIAKEQNFFFGTVQLLRPGLHGVDATSTCSFLINAEQFVFRGYISLHGMQLSDY